MTPHPHRALYRQSQRGLQVRRHPGVKIKLKNAVYPYRQRKGEVLVWVKSDGRLPALLAVNRTLKLALERVDDNGSVSLQMASPRFTGGLLVTRKFGPLHFFRR